MKLIREFDDFDWIDDVTPTFYDFWENNLLEEGDILTLRGKTSDIAGRPVFLDGAKLQIKKLYPHFLTTKVMFDPETQKKLGIYNVTKVVDADGELIVLDHQRGGSLEEDPSEPQLYESEVDDFDWIRDIQPPSFKDAVIGQTYDIKATPLLLDAIRECNDTELIYFSKRATVIDKDNLPYRDVVCGSEREDKVLALHLEFLDEEGLDITLFWVTEDMVQLY